MKPKLKYQTRVSAMDCLRRGIFETKAIVNEIRHEAEQDVSSEKQLFRCVAAIKEKFTQGLRPRRYSGLH